MADPRPLSPHLQIYRPQLTSVLSIIHRATGLVLGLGTIFLVWWLYAAAAGPGTFDLAQAFWRSWIGMLLMSGFTFSLFFHLCNGVRHLFWDAGYGFELRQAYLSGWTAVTASVALTLIAWIAGMMLWMPT